MKPPRKIIVAGQPMQLVFIRVDDYHEDGRPAAGSIIGMDDVVELSADPTKNHLITAYVNDPMSTQPKPA